MVVQNQSQLDEAVHKELGDRLVRAATTASSLEAEQDSGSGPRCQETIRDTISQTRFERVSKHFNDSLLAKARVESSGFEESLGEDSSKHEMRIDAIDADEDITLVNDADNEMFDVDELGGEEIHKEVKKSYYQIVRVDGKSQMYMIFSQMLKSYDMEDLEDLYKLVKARYGSTRPIERMDYLLWSDMKTMFEPHVEDKSIQIYMLVEKKYPFTPPTLSMMLEKKL
nr:hypothetical protein [Tanacetum cinerariifolium]